MPQPILHNVRILDFTWVLAGPYATRLLADFGAEVIKVQPRLPEAGDRYSRGYAATWNRNKLGITLNMAHPSGIDIARRLIGISDAVAENFSPRVMANWGLDYPELKKIRPDIIYLSLSVMGHSGPHQDYTGFGPTVQSLAGLTALTAYPGEPPLGTGYSYADHAAGLYASLAVLGALEYRRHTGRGQHIDLSQTETLASLMADYYCEYQSPRGNAALRPDPSREAAFQGVYRCGGEDRWCALTIASEEDWLRLKRALGKPAWVEDPRFATAADRRKNREALDSLIQDWCASRTDEEAAAIWQREGLAAGPVRTAADLFDDPQLRERHFFREMEHPELGRTLLDASPIRLSENPAAYLRAAPAAGQDNEYVYRDLLGMSRTEIEMLRAEGVI